MELRNYNGVIVETNGSEEEGTLKPNGSKPVAKQIGGTSVGMASALFFESEFGKKIAKSYGPKALFGFEPEDNLVFEPGDEELKIKYSKIKAYNEKK